MESFIPSEAQGSSSNALRRPIRFGPWIFPLFALLFVAAGYATTLQTSIGASNDPSPQAQGIVGPLMDDSGEFVVAWHTWGVAHPPGYPLLNLTANLLTRLFEALGLTAIVSANLVSYLFALLGLVVLVWPLRRRGGALGAAMAILLAAFGGLVWLYASVAEVYAFALFLGFGTLCLAIRLGEQPTVQRALWLGFLVGLALGHHRTLGLFVPSWVVAAWGARRLGWKVWMGAAGMAVLSLGVYAYLPIAAAAGSPWVYGRSPLTWEGLLDALLAREYLGQLPVEGTLSPWAMLWERVRFLAQEMTWPGLVLGVIGVILGLVRRKTRRLAVIYGLIPLGYLFAPVSQLLLIGTHLPIMAASWALAAAWGMCLMRTRGILQGGQLVLTLAVAAMVFVQHRPNVLIYTRDPLGERIIAAAAAIDEEHPTLLEVWGPRYYALAYGKWASKELAHIRLLDGRNRLEVLSTLPELPETLYTTEAVLYLYGPEVWAERLGGPVALESAGDGLVAIRRTPRRGEASTPPTEVEIALDRAVAWVVENGDVRLTLEWRALRRPAVDYNVFVHVYGVLPGGGPEQILAQGDRQHPVYGFYPTSHWSPGECVRDDYRIPLPKGSHPNEIRVGLYLIKPEGGFENRALWHVPIGGD